MSPNDTAHQIVISVNPKAGRSSPMLRAEELRDRLREKKFEVELLTDLNEVAAKANAYHAEHRLKALIGVGGDGTAATLVNLTTPGTPVTLLSAGTANLISKFFRLGRTPKRMAETIATGKTLTLDAGRLKTATDERLFLVMMSCGFDADVVRQVHAHRETRYKDGHKKGAHISYFSYIKPIWQSVKTYRYPKMSIESVTGNGDTQMLETGTKMAFFFNVNAYGWGLPLAPFAKGDDQKLDHVLFRGGSLFQALKYVTFAQCCGMHRVLSDVNLGQGTRYRIFPTDADASPIAVQIDGDPCGVLPAEIEIMPNRWTMLVPQ